MSKKPAHKPDAAELDDHTLDCIRNLLRNLRFGEIRLVVQDGVVVQVERTEKIRLPRGN